MSGRQRQQRPVHSRIRKRPVSFGNPALGTYHGTVYTTEGGNLQHDRPLVEGAVEVERLVAMVDVPPEQVPEGILNLARSHQPWILHVRIVIAEGKKGQLVVQQQQQQQQDARNQEEEETKEELSYTMPLSHTVSAAESAASILAAEHSLVEAVAATNDRTEPHTRVQQFSETTTEDTEASQSRSYVVLFELTDDDAAEQLVQDLHGKPYTSLDETECCSVFHVVALQGEDGVSLMSPFFAPATKSNAAGGLEIVPSLSSESGHDPQHRNRVGSQDSSNSVSVHNGSRAVTHPPHHQSNEDYNCAVCLEHMDLDLHSSSERPSILTTVCNHSFHMDCLLQWQDSPCPVCRYDHSGLNEALSQCHICGTTEHNYVCLICGVISCGGGPSRLTASATTGHHHGHQRDDDDLDQCCQSGDTPSEMLPGLPVSHSRQHYTETLHAYALDTETQHVFDFAGGGYVHRLLQNKNDGKLVEVSDPYNTTSQERSLNPGLSEAQEGEVVHRKLEGFASQYYTLLKSQLEQQRIFYEGRLEEIRRDHYSHGKARLGSQDLITALKQERHQLSQRKGTLQAKCGKVNKDVAFLKSMNESLEANKAPLNIQIVQAQKEQMEARRVFEECLPPLQEKVSSLMFQLETEFLEEEQEESKKPAPRK
jgi:BRCA1-associated protein